MGGIEAEELAAIMEHEAEAVGHQSPTHTAVVALDEADHHPVLVGDGKVGGVALALQLGRDQCAGGEGRGGLGGVDQGEALLAVFIGEQLRRGLGKGRVGIEARGILKGEALGFGDMMQHLGAAALPLCKVNVLENIDHLQRGEALAVGRQFAQFVALAVMGAGDIHPLAAMRGEIGEGEGAALPLQVIDHHLCQSALVEGIAPARCNRLERLRQIGVAEHLAGPGRAAIGEPGGARVGKVERRALQLHLVVLQPARHVHRDHRRDRVAFARIADRGGEHLFHRQPAVARVEFEPRIDRAGDGDGERADRRQAGRTCGKLRLELLQRLPGRRAARAVDADEIPARRVPYDREQIAADAVAGRLHQPERGIGGDGGIDRRAARLEDIERDLGCERVRGGGHAVRGDHRTAAPLCAHRAGTGADAGGGLGRGAGMGGGRVLRG